jgi:ketosteroid isomerase-like protein
MTSRGEIENLLYEYQERIDAGDLAGMAALFEHAVVGADTVETRWTGTAEVAQMFTAIMRIYDDGSPHTTHTTTNPIIHIDEQAGTATSRSVYVVYQQADRFALQPIITGRYHDRFERVHGTWRYTERIFVAGLQGDLTAHQVLEDHPVFDEAGHA